VSDRYSPDEWGRAVWAEVARAGSQAVVVEDNAGGDMVEHVLATTWDALRRESMRVSKPLGAHVPIARVHPSGEGQGKWARAQPVGLLLEQGRWHFVIDPDRRGWSTGLEDQSTSWTGKPDEVSPDRVDAMVHGGTWLLFPARRAEPKKKRAGNAPVARRPAGQRWAGGAGPSRRG
jgi:phage terminase large subunit-like protein